MIKADLLIVPTAGFDAATGIPTEAGRSRLRSADEALRFGETQAIAIIGGRRLSGPGEAEVYYRYAQEHFDRVAMATVIVDASATCTNRNLLAVADKIRSYLASVGKDMATAELGVTSYEQHMERVAIVLRRMGYKRPIQHRHSFEPRAYPKDIEELFNWITKLDPGWKCLGLPFVWLANRRLKEVLNE